LGAGGLVMLLAVAIPPDDTPSRSTDRILEVLYAIDPRPVERARRVDFAMTLIRLRMPRDAVCGEVQRKFGVSQPTGWRIVDMAVDMAGEL